MGGDTKAPIGGPGMPPHTPAPQSEILQGKYNGIHMRPEPGLSSAVAKAWAGLAWAGWGAKLSRNVGQRYDLLSYINPY